MSECTEIEQPFLQWLLPGVFDTAVCGIAQLTKLQQRAQPNGGGRRQSAGQLASLEGQAVGQGEQRVGEAFRQ